jgi:prevent-host-death family protein
MLTYSISEAKNRLSALLAKVRKGARIVITDRGVPVAALVPLVGNGAPGAAGDARLARLERAGLVVRRAISLPTAAFQAAPPTPAGGASAVAALLADRADDR